MIYGVFADTGLVNAEYIPLIDYSISRVINDLGQFSISVDSLDLNKIGIKNPLNRWVVIDGIGDTTPFVGVVRDYNVSLGERVVEISGASLEIILADRAIGSIATSSRPSGTIASQLMRSTTINDFLPIFQKRVDERSLPVSWDNNSNVLYDAIQSVAQISGYEWMLEFDGVSGAIFVFQPRIGEDKSRSVMFYESVHIINGSFAYTIEGMANSIVASGTRSLNGERALTVTVNDWDSISEYGRIEQRKDYYGMLGKATIYAAARTDVARMSKPMSGISFSCTTESWKTNNIKIGDTISIVANGMPRIIPCRITAYSIGTDGLVDVTGVEEYEASISEGDYFG